MKVALVHDYLREYGGAERVLKVLTEMYPEASIYTAFSVKDSTANKQFKDRIIHESWLAPILKIANVFSPLRFLIPWIWGSFDFSKYDIVITSCSWYIARGFKIGHNTKVIAYCHTPPRWLYGYETSVGFTKYWLVKIYASIVGHFLRMYDFKTAQMPERNSKIKTQKSKFNAGVDFFVANSENVKRRIEKFYRRNSVVIYPPVDVEKIIKETKNILNAPKKEDYFLIVSRLVGAKGIEEAGRAFQSKSMSKLARRSFSEGGYKLKVVGEAAGFSDMRYAIRDTRYGNIEFLGRVEDGELWKLYAGAKGFIALARDEDFGMTVVEAQAAGCPVLAYRGGGFCETVKDGQTGIFVDATDEKTITDAVERFINTRWNKNLIVENARRFSKERFIKEMNTYVVNLKTGKMKFGRLRNN